MVRLNTGKLESKKHFIMVFKKDWWVLFIINIEYNLILNVLRFQMWSYNTKVYTDVYNKVL